MFESNCAPLCSLPRFIYFRLDLESIFLAALSTEFLSLGIMNNQRMQNEPSQVVFHISGGPGKKKTSACMYVSWDSGRAVDTEMIQKQTFFS